MIMISMVFDQKDTTMKGKSRDEEVPTLSTFSGFACCGGGILMTSSGLSGSKKLPLSGDEASVVDEVRLGDE